MDLYKKGKLLEMMKHYFIDKPIICTIGSGSSNLKMFKHSSVAIEFAESHNENSYNALYQGDIIVNNLESFVYLL